MGSKLRFPDGKSLQCGAGALGCRDEWQDPAERLQEARGWGAETFPGVERGLLCLLK